MLLLLIYREKCVPHLGTKLIKFYRDFTEVSTENDFN